MKKQLSRRLWLKTIGVGAMASPFVPWLASRAQGEVPRRLLIYYQGVGNYGESVRATGGETDFQIPALLAPLEPHRQRLTFLRGVDQRVVAHQGFNNDHPEGAATSLTGAANGNGTAAANASVDQIIATGLEPTPFRSLHLSVRNYDEDNGLIWSGPGQYVPYARDAQAAFNAMFAGGLLEMRPDPSGEPPISRRRSVLDVVLADLERVRARSSHADRRKLEAHTDAIRALELRLNAPDVDPEEGARCSEPSLSTGNARVELRNCVDVALSALACELTNVAVVVASPGRYPWLHDSEHHELSHWNSGNLSREVQRQRLDQISAFHAAQFAEILDGLVERQMTESTLCLWCEEHTTTQQDQHGREDLHYVLGGAEGVLRTGRKLDFGGRPHNDLLISLCHLMGLNSIDTVGLPELCDGGLPGLM